jgi:hypothetical protein
MIFHPWLHPQDLLLDPGLASKLDTFLARVAEKRKRGVLEVMTMGELATVLTRERLHKSLEVLPPIDAGGLNQR